MSEFIPGSDRMIDRTMVHNTPAVFHSVSETLKLAYDEQSQKPQYATSESDPCLALWIAAAVKHNNPEAFNLDNPADLMTWVFVSD